MVTSRRGRPRSFDRDEALDAAARLFWERGYEATSIRDLTDRLGVEAPSLYRAFGDKRALFEAAVLAYDRRYGGLIESAMNEPGSAYDAAKLLLTEGPARYTRDGLPRGCLVVSGDAGTADPSVIGMMTALRSTNVERLAARIRHDVESGVLPEDVDVRALAIFTMSALNGLAEAARSGSTYDELVRVGAIALSAWPVPAEQAS